MPRWVLSSLNRKLEADLGLQNRCTTIMHDYHTSTLLEKIKSIVDENTSKWSMTDKIMATVRLTDKHAQTCTLGKEALNKHTSNIISGQSFLYANRPLW